MGHSRTSSSSAMIVTVQLKTSMVMSGVHSDERMSLQILQKNIIPTILKHYITYTMLVEGQDVNTDAKPHNKQ